MHSSWTTLMLLLIVFCPINSAKWWRCGQYDRRDGLSREVLQSERKNTIASKYLVRELAKKKTEWNEIRGRSWQQQNHYVQRESTEMPNKN